MMTLSKLGRIAFGLLCVATTASGVAAQSADSEVLTNTAIVQMVTGKLSRSLILAKITTARPGYDLSSGGLVYLTTNKIDETVIRAMISAAESAIQGGSAPTSLAGVDEVLTNDAVVRMTVGKVSRKLIVSKILSSPTAFDVSAMGLLRLKEAKVPDDIVKTMLSPPPSGAAAALPEGGQRQGDAKGAATPTSTPTPVKAEDPKVPIASTPKSAVSVANVPPPVVPGCDGIELMGMGSTGKVAGVEVFIAKIRNATSMTRIVDVEYRPRGEFWARTTRTEVASGAIRSIQLGTKRPQSLKLRGCR